MEHYNHLPQTPDVRARLAMHDLSERTAAFYEAISGVIDLQRVAELFDKDTEGSHFVAGLCVQLEHFIALPAGWDGPNSKSPDLAALSKTLALLSTIYHARLPAPALVPMRSGAVQAEWHAGESLEIAVGVDGVVIVDDLTENPLLLESSLNDVSLAALELVANRLRKLLDD